MKTLMPVLTTCKSCRHPFAQADAAGACPHCGATIAEEQTAAEKKNASDDDEREEATLSSVVAEGGEGAPEPRRRRRRIEGPAPSLKDGHPTFEDPSLPKVGAFFSTFIDVVFRPRAFFGHLSLEGARGITWFAYLCLVASFLWNALGTFFVAPLLRWLLGVLDEVEGAEVAIVDLQHQIEILPTLAVVSLIAAPILAFFFIHLVSGLLHGTLRLLNIGGEPVPYDQTYRFAVYATAPLALGILPGASFVSHVWFLVVLVIAMRRLHRIRSVAVIAGVLLPVILLSQVGAATLALTAESIVNYRKSSSTAASPASADDAK